MTFIINYQESTSNSKHTTTTKTYVHKNLCRPLLFPPSILWSTVVYYSKTG
jgi:hypothetical protein